MPFGFRKQQTNSISVEPCEHCLEQAREEGYSEGFEEGQDSNAERGE